MVGELQDKLRSDEAEAAAVRHFVTSVLMAQENLEQYLRTEKAQVKSYQIENRRLRARNLQGCDRSEHGVDSSATLSSRQVVRGTLLPLTPPP
ncbi:hypothetical protein JG687_00014614 [Phytophthora cactorum]|uniref:Uncharacterized protein n=1 Tax=Phytophthora cactorum TaxID=29920 RepID=A0A8T1TWJ3_9STRA|nr:hypothetical protein JG687_00014614 [Phytophthora cactorum]